MQTLFYHFMGLPLFPQETYWVEGNPLFGWSQIKVLEIGRSWPSIVAGYLRGWTLMVSIYVVCIGVALWFMPPPQIPGDPMPLGHTIVVPILVALGLGGLPLAAGVWLFTRRPLAGDEAARRAVYQQFFGIPVDPALLHGDVSLSLRGQGLVNDLVSAGYQLGIGKHEELKARWPDLAVDPRMARPDLLRLAMTIARFEQGKATAEVKGRLAALEQRLWAQLVQLDPSVRGGTPSVV